MNSAVVLSVILLLLHFNVNNAHSHEEEVHGAVPAEKSEKAVNSEAAENGRSIYFKGISLRSGMLTHSYGTGLLTEEDNHTCVVCHGDYGEGEELDDERVAIAPDIRYSVLLEKQYCHEGHEGVHVAYTDKLIKRSIVEGINPIGKMFSKDMPRYNMSDEDFNDLLEFLKTLK
ncbi:MAG: cytochrome c [Nitrospira sp.]|nr:cytochrome c [Nitrospira sp.]